MSASNINWGIPTVRPLDLSNTHPQRYDLLNGAAAPNDPCIECKELRKEVREVRDNLKVLMDQFTNFAGSWNNKYDHKSSHGTTPEIPDSSTTKSTVQSPPSSASSGGTDEVSSNNFGHKDALDRESPASSNTSNSSTSNNSSKQMPPTERKRKTASVEYNPLITGMPPSTSLNMNSLLNVATEQHKRARPMHLQGMGQHPGVPGGYGNHALSSMSNIGVPCGGLPPAAWSLLWGLPSWPQQQPHPSAYPQFMNNRPMHPGFGEVKKEGISASPPSSGEQSNSPKDLHNLHTLADATAQVLRPTPRVPQSKIEQNIPLAPTSQALSLHCVNSSFVVASNAHRNDHTMNQDKDRLKKRPGPDDFIKEFLELEMAQEEEKGKIYHIPVPEAIQYDPDFEPQSEEELLRSCRWEELDWTESVTRLAKKLAEKRVFGPALMARTTVAGSNHSNYPNLPLEGIMYIESVCRRVLFPGMSRRQFAEFFRPAIKGLAARCRRIRHSLKPSATGEDTEFVKKVCLNEEEEELVVEDLE